MKQAWIFLTLLAVWGFAQDDARERLNVRHFSVTYSNADVEAEVNFGREVAGRILKQHPLVRDDAVLKYVNLVGQSVAMQVSRSEIRYYFAVIKSDQVNAYAAPGGYVFITTALLESLKDEAELAAVLAHEIAHVTQKHIVKALDIKGSDDSLGGGMARFLGGAGDTARVAFSQAVDKALGLLFDDGVSRDDEYEADKVGLEYLALTGYDAAALSRYLGRIAKLKGDQLNVLHKTHPTFDSRLQRLAMQMQDEGLNALHYPQAKERFRTHVHF